MNKPFDAIIEKLCNVKIIHCSEEEFNSIQGAHAIKFISGGREFALMCDNTNKENNYEIHKKELEVLKIFLEKTEKNLLNENFTNKAPKEIVDKEYKKWWDCINKIIFTLNLCLDDLEEQINKYKMKQFLEIKADTHDADYVTSRSEVTDETLQMIQPVIDAIKNFKPYTTNEENLILQPRTHMHNFPFGETYPREQMGEKSAHELYVKSGLCTEDEFETFAELLPSGDIHTITDIDLLYIANEEKLYEHKI